MFKCQLLDTLSETEFPMTLYPAVQFSRSVVSDSLPPHGLQHARLPCLLPTPRAYSNSCPLSQWCHPTISSSVVPFSSHLQSFPASVSFPMNQFFTSGGQIIGASASASVLPMNIQDWFPLGLTGLTSLQSKGLSRVFSNTSVQKHQFFGTQLSLLSKPVSLTSPALAGRFFTTSVIWEAPVNAKTSGVKSEILQCLHLFSHLSKLKSNFPINLESTISINWSKLAPPSVCILTWTSGWMQGPCTEIRKFETKVSWE